MPKRTWKAQPTGKGCCLPKHCVCVFVSSTLLIWGFPSSRLPACLPACRHRLDFKFSKHYSEAALRSGQQEQYRPRGFEFQRRPRNSRLVSQGLHTKTKPSRSLLKITVGQVLFYVRLASPSTWPLAGERPCSKYVLLVLLLRGEDFRLQKTPPLTRPLCSDRFYTRSGPDTQPFTSTSPLTSSGKVTDCLIFWMPLKSLHLSNMPLGLGDP